MPTGVKKDFWDYVKKTSGCWHWHGAKARNGYGKIHRAGRTTSAHQFAYEQEFGPVPAGKELLHWCDNKLCVRVAPGHVQLGTHMENVRDCVIKRLHAFGEIHGKAKLTDEEVDEIKERYAAGEKQSDIAEDYGIRQSQVSRIVNGRQRSL